MELDGLELPQFCEETEIVHHSAMPNADRNITTSKCTEKRIYLSNAVNLTITVS